MEYFGQVPKFFNCHYCDNCLRLKKDITKKIYKYLIENKDFFEVFKEKQIEKLKELDLLSVYGDKVKIYQDLINWKKIINVNNINMENMKEKYRIFI